MHKPAGAAALTDEERATAIGQARHACEYIDAAHLVDRHVGQGRPHALISVTPACFLAAHGIELTLKAYLRHNGIPVRDLGHKYGRDLRKCCSSKSSHSPDLLAKRRRNAGRRRKAAMPTAATSRQ